MAKSIEDMQKLLVKKEAELNKFISGKEEYIRCCATELFNYMLDKLNDQVYMNSFSDAGIIMGDNKYKTPYELWQLKTFKTPLELESVANSVCKWGHILEGVVAQELEY